MKSGMQLIRSFIRKRRKKPPVAARCPAHKTTFSLGVDSEVDPTPSVVISPAQRPSLNIGSSSSFVVDFVADRPEKNGKPRCRRHERTS
jgi:hypothetical protein